MTASEVPVGRDVDCVAQVLAELLGSVRGLSSPAWYRSLDWWIPRSTLDDRRRLRRELRGCLDEMERIRRCMEMGEFPGNERDADDACARELMFARETVRSYLAAFGRV